MITPENPLNLEASFYSIFRYLVHQKARIRIELKNDGIVRGTLSFVDTNMNMYLTQIQSDEATFSKTIEMKSCFIRGSAVKFIHILKGELDLELVEKTWKSNLAEKEE